MNIIKYFYVPNKRLALLIDFLFLGPPGPACIFYVKKISWNKQKFSPLYWFNPFYSFIRYVRICLCSFAENLNYLVWGFFFKLQHKYNYLLIIKFIPDPAPFIIFLLLCCFCRAIYTRRVARQYGICWSKKELSMVHGALHIFLGIILFCWSR